MINVSNQFRQELEDDNRRYLCFADITLRDGTVLGIRNSGIWSGGFSTEESVSGDTSFDIGAVVINKSTIVINNMYEDFSEYDFAGARVVLKIGLELSDGTVETINKGKFTVDEPKYSGSLITLESLDDMRKFDRSYKDSNLTYPATRWEILQDACVVCDVSLGIASIPNGNVVVQERPADDALTFRQMLQWIGQLSCVWFKMDRFGQLVSGWYDLSALEGTSGNRHNIHSLKSQNIGTDDVVITGVKVAEYASDSQVTPVSYLKGEEGYVLEVSQNRLITEGIGEETAAYLGSKLIGLRFRPLNITCMNDPTIEAGDVAVVTDYKGNEYKTLITGTKFQTEAAQSVTCGAKSPARNSATRYGQSTQAYVDARKEAQKNRTEMDKAVEILEGKLNNASGMFSTEKESPDGSIIRYLHDKKTLEESKNVIKFSSEAIGFSNDGGETYPYGFTLTGEMITNLLQTIGVNAGWINTGTIAVKNKGGKETFYVNVDTGTVRIDADNFSLKGKNVQTTIEEMSEKITSIESDLAIELTSNHGTFQKMDKNGVLTPDYTVNPLIMTPKAFFAKEEIAGGMSYVWKRKVSGVEMLLLPGESVSADGTLTVSNNLTESTRYICYATYTVSETEKYVANAYLDFTVVADGDNGKDGVWMCIESTEGFMFDSSISSVLTARIYEGETEVDPDGAFTYTWYGRSDGDWEVIGAGKTITLSSLEEHMRVYFEADGEGVRYILTDNDGNYLIDNEGNRLVV